MRKSYVTTLILMMATFGMISCSEELKPTPYTYSKNFTGENNKTWKIKFFEYTLDGEVDDTFTVSCSTDDLFTFYANSEHLFQVATGSRRCSDTEGAVITDAWTFSNATATLTMVVPAFSADFSLPFFVREVSDDEMELEIFIDENNTESYRIHFEATDEE